MRFATAHELPLAVRGGGHSIPGHSVCDGGIVVDLSPMRAIDVDAAGRRAHAQPGCTLGELDAATDAAGLATPGGEISHTGIAGLTLGGGVGWLSRMYGLACDNLVEAEVVTAQGEIVTAGGENGDPDLLWGLRGGGGNFGVVTRFSYRLHPIRPMLGGMVAFGLDRGRDVLALFRELAAAVPDEVSLTCACVTAPPAPFVPEHLRGRPIVAIGLLHVGDPADGQPWADRLRAARPELDLLAVMPYPAVQSMVDEGAPPGLHNYVKSEWLAGLDDAAVDRIVEAAATRTSPLSQVLLRQLGGAIARVPADATAFSYRDAAMLLTVPAIWASADEDRTPHRRLGPGAVDRPATAVERRRLRQPARRRRGSGPGPGRVRPGHLAATGRAEAPVRPGQRVPPQPEHPARRMTPAGRPTQSTARSQANRAFWVT